MRTIQLPKRLILGASAAFLMACGGGNQADNVAEKVEQVAEEAEEKAEAVKEEAEEKAEEAAEKAEEAKEEAEEKVEEAKEEAEEAAEGAEAALEGLAEQLKAAEAAAGELSEEDQGLIDAFLKFQEDQFKIFEDNKEDLDAAAEKLSAYIDDNKESLTKTLKGFEARMSGAPEETMGFQMAVAGKMGAIMERGMKLQNEIPNLTEHEGVKKALDKLQELVEAE